LFVFVVLGLVSSVLCQEISWDECLRNDLFCVEWDLNAVNQFCHMCFRISILFCHRWVFSSSVFSWKCVCVCQ